jgi:hypothetical protein
MEREPKMCIYLGKEISNENTPLIVLLPMHGDSLKKLKTLGRGGKSPTSPQKNLICSINIT